MRKHFEKQIKDNMGDVTEDNIGKLKGKSIYSKYQVGDQVLTFLEKSDGVSDDGKPEINVTIRMVADRELDKLAEDYNFLEMHNTLPILERKNQ